MQRHCICLELNFDSILIGVELNLWNFDFIRLAIAEFCGHFETILREGFA